MSDEAEGQGAVIERLDRLIEAVNRLTEVVLAQGNGVANAVTSAAPQARSPQATRQESAPSAPLQPSLGEPRGETLDVEIDDQLVTGLPGPGAPYEHALARMFEAALVADNEGAWRELAAMTHPQELIAPRALDSLKAFSWKQLRKNAPMYLKDGQAASFSVVRTDPADPRGDEERIKIFLSARGRSPAPITLKRDMAAGGAWRLGQVSL